MIFTIHLNKRKNSVLGAEFFFFSTAWVLFLKKVGMDKRRWEKTDFGDVVLQPFFLKQISCENSEIVRIMNN